MKPQVSRIDLGLLSYEQRSFLHELMAEYPNSGHGIPVYLIYGDEVAFIRDCNLSSRANRRFEREAPSGLYRGGAIIRVLSKHGTLVVPDERYGWFKPFAGMARFAEGHDLALTGGRELIEEAFVYDIKKTTRYVPQGFLLSSKKECTLDFTVERIIELNPLIVLGYELNNTNRAFEVVLGWNINGIDDPYSISLEEKWFTGGRNGVSVYAIDSGGKITGIFSGQQGFLEIPRFGIHESLKKYL